MYINAYYHVYCVVIVLSHLREQWCHRWGESAGEFLTFPAGACSLLPTRRNEYCQRVVAVPQ